MDNIINILDSWIMMERLSQGEFSEKPGSGYTKPENDDFYSQFKEKIQEKMKKKSGKGGIEICFDIFSFKTFLDMLWKMYSIKNVYEELKTPAKKFSFVLYFDSELNLCNDDTFFTECAYIRYNKKVPFEDEFKEYEKDFKKELDTAFENASSDKNAFNKAMSALLNRFNIRISDCQYRFVKNLEDKDANLHSFFISDLEEAKKLALNNKDGKSNLRAYLYGLGKERINLDSKSDSPNVNPEAFEEILQPKNYPSGRFPSCTDYALYFMQQVAVNISSGSESNIMHSVNGPPGTGKTTLLKDVFAELVVKQSYDISRLSGRNIQASHTSGNISIGALPEFIAENSILVASSNNGAVQNIVNELPLIKDVDGDLRKMLCDADYFKDIANVLAKHDSSEKKAEEEADEFTEDEISKEAEDAADNAPQTEKKADDKEKWGLFSLQGGNKTNRKKLDEALDLVVTTLNEECEPEAGIYAEFLKQYEEIKAFKDKMQSYADKCLKLKKLKAEKEALMSPDSELSSSFNTELLEIEKKINEHKLEKNRLESEISHVRYSKVSLEKKKNELLEERKKLNERKPGIFAGRSIREHYKLKIAELDSRLSKVNADERLQSQQEKRIIKQISGHERLIKNWQSGYREAKQNVEKRRELIDTEIAELENYFTEHEKNGSNDIPILEMNCDYNKLQRSNPWFDKEFRVRQSKLFISALRVRKQFLYENRSNVEAAVKIWENQDEYSNQKGLIRAAWVWVNMIIPVISSTFSSIHSMFENLGEKSIGRLFVDEAGQAVPQAAVGAVLRSRYIMVVGDPSQIKPVLTLDSKVIGKLREQFGVSEKYLSDSASVQTLVDKAGQYGFYRSKDKSEESWIGIPLWVHRRCLEPMFSIANEISYNGYMVHGNPGNGKAYWYDIKGKAVNKYVEEQGDFLVEKISEMIKDDPSINNQTQKNKIYVISPFKNVAAKLAAKLNDELGFTRYNGKKPENVGTVHTFQGKEAPIVFMVLGADDKSSNAAGWAVSEANIMNVAATRAKEEFYVIGDKKLYCDLSTSVAGKTADVIDEYYRNLTYIGTVKAVVKKDNGNSYAYVTSEDGVEYPVSERIYSRTENAEDVIVKDKKIIFRVVEGKNKPYASYIRPYKE